jgi:archaellum biogenesis ATPase FlaH
MTDFSNIVLRNLQYNMDYTRKVLPFIKVDYFETTEQKIYFACIEKFFNKYNKLPSKEVIDIQLQNLKIKQDIYDNLVNLSDELYGGVNQPVELNWLIDETEEFCQNRSLFLALGQALEISEGSSKDNLSKTAIPEILSKALSVSFDTEIGHDYIEDALARYKYYTNVEFKVPLFLDSINFICNGGIPPKTLNAFISETGGGKSIMLCNLAANYIQNNQKVLYITLEMAAEEIGKRIDANLMDVGINKLDELDEEDYIKLLEKVKSKGISSNNLVIKQFPTSSAHASHFRFLMDELKQKRGFEPTIVIIDYLNICASSKIKNRTSMYEYIKSISEELRALATETNTILWTALQFNTDGTANSDPEITDVAESRGLNHTLDLLLALVTTEDSAAQGQVMVKQLKSRYGDKNKNTRFFIGLDKDKMRFYDLQGTQFSQTVMAYKATRLAKQTKRVEGIKV